MTLSERLSEYVRACFTGVWIESHEHPDGRWTADLSPVNGPLLGPFPHRSAALAAERDWLLANWLARKG